MSGGEESGRTAAARRADQLDSPVLMLLNRLRLQSREARLGWFSRPLLVAIISALLIVSCILILQLDDMLQSAPLDATEILGGLDRFHGRLVYPLLVIPGLFVVFAGLASFSLPAYVDGAFVWRWEYLMIPAAALLFLLAVIGLYKCMLYGGVQVGTLSSHPLAQHCIFWAGLAIPLAIILALLAVLESSGLAGQQLELAIGSARLVALMLPAVAAIPLRNAAIRAIRSVQQGRTERQRDAEAPAPPARRGSNRLLPAARLAGICALLLPLLLAASVLIQANRMQHLRYDTGDPFLDWYLGYAQETVNRRFLDGINTMPTKEDVSSAAGIGSGHYYIADLMQQSEAQFADDPRWQVLRFELLEVSDREDGNAISVQDLIARVEGVRSGNQADSTLCLLILQRLWSQLDEDANADAAGNRSLLGLQARKLARAGNSAAPLYWLAAADETLDSAERMELIREGNELPCEVHTGSFRGSLLRGLPPEYPIEADRIMCAMQPLANIYSDNGPLDMHISLKELAKQLAADGNGQALNELATCSIRLVQTEGLHPIHRLGAMTLLRKIATELRSNASLSAEQAAALDEYEAKINELLDSHKQLTRNWEWDLATQVTRIDEDYMPGNLPGAIEAPIKALEMKLSLGRYFAIAFFYEINTFTQELRDGLSWYRQHKDQWRGLQDFDFQTVGWRDEK